MPQQDIDDSSAATARPRARESLALVLILLVATALRSVNLDDQLWLDEISALTGSIQRPFIDIVSQWPGAASHILYELMARIGLLTVGLPVGIRLPAVVFGVVSVGLAYAFARRAFGYRPAIFIAALLAVSYHHVFFSQNARGYTLLIALYMATLLILTRVQREGGASYRMLAVYALAGALAAYSMPMGLFILPAQALVVLTLWWRARAKAGPAPVPLRVFGASVAGGALAALLYAPFVPGIVRFTRANASAPDEGPRMGVGLVHEVLDGLLGAFHGPVGLAVVIGFGVVGLVSWWRRHPASLAFALAPLVLEAVVVVTVGIGIHPRYFAIALPVLLIVAGLGVESTVTAGIARLPLAPRRRAMASSAVLASLVILSAWPLARYYRYPKQDFRGAITAVDSMSPPCQLKVGVGVAGHVLEGYYHAGFVTAENLAELRTMEAPASRLCVVTTLEVLLSISDPEIVTYLNREYRRSALLPGTLGDGAMRIYERTIP